MNPQEQLTERDDDPRDDAAQKTEQRSTRPELQGRAAIPLGDGSSANKGPAYLEEHSENQVGERWRQVQAAFVDDPRKAVAEAHELVGELTQRIVDTFARERADLERQWSSGDNVSTEDLRMCLKRYRSFFSRLLPSVDKLAHAD